MARPEPPRTDRDDSRRSDAGGATNDGDTLLLQGCLILGGLNRRPRRMNVPDDRLEVERRRTGIVAVPARCLTRRLRQSCRVQQGFARHTSCPETLATEPPPLHEGHPQTERGSGDGSGKTAGAGANDGDVELGLCPSHRVCSI